MNDDDGLVARYRRERQRRVRRQDLQAALGLLATAWLVFVLLPTPAQAGVLAGSPAQAGPNLRAPAAAR